VVYVPLAQVPADGVNLVIRSRMDTASVMGGVREALRQIDPNLPVGDVATMQQIREGTLAGVSRPAWLIGAFATIAALLAAIGLYGVLSQAVAQRRREMGIRMALGARSQDVIAHVMRDALALIAVGVIAGMFGALMLTRLMKSMLFEVSPLDPMALGLACASIVSIGLMAAFFPASRAARVDPALTLREEG
jgi:putative ABC transport system permease protein